MSLLPHLGFLELLLLAALALIVVGPKDLPRLMHGVGKVVGQARHLANEFRAGFEQMAREAEIDEMRAEMERLKTIDPVSEVKNALDDAVTPLQEETNKRIMQQSASSSSDKTAAPDRGDAS